MKKPLLFLLFLTLLSCSTIMKDNAKFIDFNCPDIYFSTNDNFFVDTLNNSSSLDDIFIKAELNNFAISKKCQSKDKLVIFPIDILIILKPMENLYNEKIKMPLYVTLLDENDVVLETQYFMISKSVEMNSETATYIETDITDTLQVITNKFETSQLIVGFMLDENKRKFLN